MLITVHINSHEQETLQPKQENFLIVESHGSVYMEFIHERK